MAILRVRYVGETVVKGLLASRNAWAHMRDPGIHVLGEKSELVLMQDFLPCDC